MLPSVLPLLYSLKPNFGLHIVIIFTMFYCNHPSYWQEIFFCRVTNDSKYLLGSTATAQLSKPISCLAPSQGRLNSLKIVGAQLTKKTHFYCEKLNSYEHLQILWGQVHPVPPSSATYFPSYMLTICVPKWVKHLYIKKGFSLYS